MTYGKTPGVYAGPRTNVPESYGWREEAQPVAVRMSARADATFRRMIALAGEVGLATQEFIACLVVEKAAPERIVRLALPEQTVDQVSCTAHRESLGQLRRELAEGEALAGSIHCHPMSLHSHATGFLSGTDLRLIKLTAMEQLLEIAHPENRLLTVEATEGNGEGATRRVRAQVLEGTVFALVNAGPVSYYGKALREILCPLCEGSHRSLHPVRVDVEPAARRAAELVDEGELRGQMRERIHLYARGAGRSARGGLGTSIYGYGQGYNEDYWSYGRNGLAPAAWPAGPVDWNDPQAQRRALLDQARWHSRELERVLTVLEEESSS